MKRQGGEGSNQQSEKEIANLQKLRATLEIVRESTEKIYKDVERAFENQQSILAETAKTSDTLKKL